MKLKESYEELDLIIRDLDNLIEKLKDEENKKYFIDVRTEFQEEFDDVEKEYFGIEDDEEDDDEWQRKEWRKENDDLEREYWASQF